MVSLVLRWGWEAMTCPRAGSMEHRVIMALC